MFLQFSKTIFAFFLVLLVLKKLTFYNHNQCALIFVALFYFLMLLILCFYYLFFFQTKQSVFFFFIFTYFGFSFDLKRYLPYSTIFIGWAVFFPTIHFKHFDFIELCFSNFNSNNLLERSSASNFLVDSSINVLYDALAHFLFYRVQQIYQNFLYQS